MRLCILLGTLPMAMASAAQAASLDDVLAMLETIPIEAEHRTGYERDQWPHWLDLDGDCLDTRQEVLLATSLVTPAMAGSGCWVVSGRWRDPYTGVVVIDPRALDIDHLVPLQEAHDSGGWRWSQEQRALFANDQRSLVAVTPEANRPPVGKGAKGPEAWLPPLPEARCSYLVTWVAVKARWGLSMDQAERRSVREGLTACSAARKDL